MAKGKFKNTLSEKEFRTGLIACLKNAKELMVDAKVLLTSGRFARATALAIIAAEEVGKANLIAMKLEKGIDEFEYQMFWGWFYHHGKKSAWAMILKFEEEEKAEGNKRKNEQSEAFWKAITAYASMYVGEQLPAIKENSLYVGFDGEVRKWGEPWVVSKADAETIVSNTEEILEKFELKCVRKKY